MVVVETAPTLDADSSSRPLSTPLPGPALAIPPFGMSEGVANFASGTAGGIAQVIVGHPFDTLKVRLQTANSGQYQGAIDCLLQTLRREKIAGLYKGVSSPLLGIGFCNAIVFTANGFFRDLLRAPGKDLSIERLTLAGALAGSAMAFANCPIELLKVRLQVQDPTKPKLYGNIFDCARQSFRQQGLIGLYRGMTPTLLRDIPSFAAYFGLYEWLKTVWRTPERHNTPLHLICAGGLAGMAAWLPCYPQDVIKSRMQSNSIYRNTIDCAVHIYSQHGLSGFFRGFGPTICRAFPANAATFFVYEIISSSLRRRHPSP